MSASGGALGVLLGLLILAAVVTLGLGLLIWGLMLMRRQKMGTEGGTCGKCGYMVKGLSVLDCPECGADLREVGIVPAKSGNRGIGIAMMVAGALVLLSLCACGGLTFVWAGASGSVSPAQPIPLPTQSQSQPAPPLHLPPPDTLESSEEEPDSLE